jgi:putative signal transducing protein
MSATAEPKPEPEPVKVFDTQQESEAMVVHGLLTSAGIESVVTNLGADQALWPGVGGVAVLVNPDKAEEARRIIEEYNNAATEIEQVEGDEDEVGD